VDNEEILCFGGGRHYGKVEEVSAFSSFCRANWGYFAALQTAALVGATFNGMLSRKRREEIAILNEKLRAMMVRPSGQYLPRQPQCTSVPPRHATAAATAALSGPVSSTLEYLHAVYQGTSVSAHHCHCPSCQPEGPVSSTQCAHIT
jgi:hypothetical protein